MNMFRTLKICVPALCLSLILAFATNPAVAQEAEASEAPAAEPEPYTVTPGPAAAETAVEAAEATEAPEAEPEPYTVTPQPSAAEIEAAAAEAAAAEAAVAESQPEVVEAAPVKPKKEKKAKPPKEPKPPKAPKEPRDSDTEAAFSIGVRGAFGASSFAGHKALWTPAYGNLAVELGAGLSGSVGLSIARDFSDLISVSADVIYTIYTARGGFSLKAGGADFGIMNEAGVELHSIEVPVLARFNNLLGPLYAEVGPQFGVNVYGKIYANSELKKPYLNAFAVGPAVGLGLGIPGKAAIGVRGCYNFIEYAENSGGRPWAVQVGITKYYIGF
jgi:hypothetical protein